MDYICANCNYTGSRKKVIGGSKLVSIALWVIIPTLYTVWEIASGPSLTADTLAALQTMQNTSIFSLENVLLTLLGPAYSIWRRVKKKYVCPNCGSKVMVPAVRGELERDYDSKKDYVIEIERKLAAIEKDIQEKKSEVHIIKQDVPKPVPTITPANPPAKREHNEENKNEW